MDNIFFNFFAFALIAKLIIQNYLSYRNQRYIQAHQEKVPSDFSEVISLPDHQKAASYNITKAKLGYFWRLLDFFILWGWLIWGLPFLFSYSKELTSTPLMRDLLFLILFSVINIVIDLPESLYDTFVVEEKFGFNKTTLALFLTDLLKQILVSILLMLPLITLLLWVIYRFETTWWIWGWAIVTLFQVILLWAYPTLIAPLFNKFSPLPEGEIKEKVEALLKHIDFPHKGLFVMDASKRSSHGNAYFTGFGKQKRIVFFDTLLKGLDGAEVEAVLAHELGHFKKKHIQKGMIKSIFFGFLSFALLGFLYQQPWFYESFHLEKSAACALLLFSLLSSAFTFWLTPLFSWSSRKHEFEADQFAAEHSSAEKLISALIKMYKDNASTLTPDPFYSKFYYSHPPALERTHHLRQMTHLKDN